LATTGLLAVSPIQKWFFFFGNSKINTAVLAVRCDSTPAKHSRGTAEIRVTLDEAWSWRMPTWCSDRQMNDPPAATHVLAMLQTCAIDDMPLLLTEVYQLKWHLHSTK